MEHFVDFLAVVDVMENGILVTDEKGLVLYVNPAFRHITGFFSREVMDKTVEEITQRENPYFRFPFQEALSSQKKAIGLFAVRRDTAIHAGYAVALPVHDKSGVLRNVVVSFHPTIPPGLLRQGFEDFLSEWRTAAKNALPLRSFSPSPEDFPPGAFFSASPSLKYLDRIIRRVAPTDATVLITGEHGTGHEEIAVEVYRQSLRARQPFVRLSVDALSIEEKDDILSRLPTLGTLFLEGLESLDPYEQPLFLRKLHTYPALRILISIEGYPERMREEGTLSDRILLKCNDLRIHLSPLRDQTDHFEDFCAFFIEKSAAKHGTLVEFTPAQMKQLKQHVWPGNLRELSGVIEFLAVISAGISEVPDHLLTSMLSISQEHVLLSGKYTFHDALSLYEKSLVEGALRRTSNFREAGSLMGSNAAHIAKKMLQYNIPYQDYERL